METPDIKRTGNPEAVIQKRIIEFLRQRGWWVMVTHGNAAQQGFPDLYAVHKDYGQRWIEVKNPNYYKFTPAQKECFPKIEEAGVGIWVLMGDSKKEYDCLFLPANWRYYHRLLLGVGHQAMSNTLKATKVKCKCGSEYMLKIGEKTTCSKCMRTVLH
jgi:hypothetical protein